MLVKVLHQDPLSGASMDQGTIIPWYNQIYTNNPTTAGYRPDFDLNDQWEQPLIGNRFRYAYLDVTGESPALISAGVTLTPSAPGTDTVASSLTDPDTGLVYGIVLVTGGLTPNAEVGNYLYMEDLGLLKTIKSNTATDVIFSTFDTLPRGPDVEAIPAGPANASNVSIIRPGHVIANTETTVTVGVTVNDVLEGEFIVMQVSGLAMFVGNNSGVALVQGVPGSAVGGGVIDGTDPTSVAQMQDCLIVPLVSYDGPNILVPAYFKASGV
jgi:hypothetical protein